MRVNALNMQEGYNLPLVLATPLEVLDDEDKYLDFAPITPFEA